MPVGFPDMASSSQTVLPSEPDVNYSQIMEALAAIQRGMSTMQLSMSSMQQSISTMQQEVHSINLRVEQNQLDLRECLKFYQKDQGKQSNISPRV
jgi:predicted  nucleic acid-binding Zn-ribbon protein